MRFSAKLFQLFVCLGLILANSAYAIENQDDKINRKDSKGKKQGKWVYYGKDRPTEGVAANGKIEEGYFKNDRKEGLWIHYYKDGITPKLKGYYINNRPSGSYTKYYASGKVMEQGNFVRNQYSDSLKRFHENGVVEYEANYNGGGKEEGAVKYYYPNGQIEFEYTAKEGNPVGKAVRYYENGDIKEIISYGYEGKVEKSETREMISPTVKISNPSETGERAPRITSPRTKGAKFLPNGYNKVYNLNDDIWQDGNFKNGLLWDGKVYEYDKDGILLKVKVFKNGIYNSDGQL